MCKKCKVGALCFDCYTATEGINNEKIATHILDKLKIRKRNIDLIIFSGLNILFPGIRKLAKHNSGFLEPFFLMIISATAYSTYINTPSLTIFYPVNIIRSISVLAVVLFAMYNLFFVLKEASYVYNNFTKAETNVS